MTRIVARAGLTAALTLVSTAAFAHPGGVHAAGFAAGFAHPFGGLDHLLAMTGLGLWAAGYAGRVRYALPLAFVAGMIGGLVLAATGVALPGVEVGIAGSVIAIGALIALGARLPALAACGVAFAAALFHGHAHGTEMAGLAAAAGIVLATAVLHGAGLAVGAAASRPLFARAVRLAGGAITAAGAVLLAAA